MVGRSEVIGTVVVQPLVGCMLINDDVVNTRPVEVFSYCMRHIVGFKRPSLPTTILN